MCAHLFDLRGFTGGAPREPDHKPGNLRDERRLDLDVSLADWLPLKLQKQLHNVARDRHWRGGAPIAFA